MVIKKVYAKCWTCGAEHDLSNESVYNENGTQTKICAICGGTVVFKTGSGIWRIAEEDNRVRLSLSDKELKTLPLSQIRRLQLQRGGNIDDIPWHKTKR